MKKKHILIYIISTLLVWASVSSNAQELEQDIDTLKPTQKHYIRLGVDISRPIIQTIQKEDLGIEITVDYQLTPKWFVALELGTASEPGHEDFITFHTKGSYAKIGANYNTYKNFGGMNNEVYFGLRYGFSRFEQKLISYTAVDYNDYFGNYTLSPNTTFDNLQAHWAELHVGLKVEVLHNFFLGSSIHFKKIINDTTPEGFANLYIPGFNSVLLSNNGIGFNYTLSYRIPL